MSGPWEKYQKTSFESEKKPWEKYALSSQSPSEIQKNEYSLMNDEFMGVSPRGLLRGTAKALPIIGSIGGGLVGAAAGPLGALGGAGLGAAAGKSLENLIESQLLDEEKTREEIYLDPIKEGLLGSAGEGAGQLVGKGLKLAAESPLGKKALGLIGKGGAKVGEALTGVSEKEIQTYAKNANKIKSLAKSSDSNVAEAADQIRNKFSNSIDQTRKSMNEQISNSLSTSNKTIKSDNILKAFDDYKSKIDPDLYPESISEINDLISKVKKISDKSGNISINRANSLKKYLQDEASAAYRYPGQGKIGTETANAAKKAASEARILINEAVPEIASANKKLSELHDIEDVLNLNLIREGKPEAGLLAAGSGGNLRNAKNLKDLGLLTGTDFLGEAENLAAMRTFGSPKLMVSDVTGKGAARAGIAALAGYAIGNVPGAALATAMTSPAALKAAIDAGRISAKVLKDPIVMRAIGQTTTRGLLNGE